MDYILNLADLIFPSGSQQGAVVCMDIDIIDDEVVEHTETFHVNLTANDTKVQILSFGQQNRVTIYDNDGKTYTIASWLIL